MLSSSNAGDRQIQKRATQYVQTRPFTPNTAQSFVRSFGLVTARVAVSAYNVIVYNIVNSGATEVAWEFFDVTTGWFVQGTLASGEHTSGHSTSQVIGKAGDKFEIDIV